MDRGALSPWEYVSRITVERTEKEGPVEVFEKQICQDLPVLGAD